jgi:hypothetical protein
VQLVVARRGRRNQIGQFGKNAQGVEQMKAVFPAPHNVEREVNLGRRRFGY